MMIVDLSNDSILVTKIYTLMLFSFLQDKYYHILKNSTLDNKNVVHAAEIKLLF